MSWFQLPFTYISSDSSSDEEIEYKTFGSSDYAIGYKIKRKKVEFSFSLVKTKMENDDDDESVKPKKKNVESTTFVKPKRENVESAFSSVKPKMENDDESYSLCKENNFPPCATSSSIKPKRKNVESTTFVKPKKENVESAFSSVKPKMENDDESYSLSKEMPKALDQALETAIGNIIPLQVKYPRLPKPPKQVLGLVCKKSVPQVKHNYQGKGKKPME